jgi:DNA-binding IclR family transcriptional regulator
MEAKTIAQATSLRKALRVLTALEGYPAGRGVTDIARALALPKSAVHRLLVTFQACAFVQQLPHSSRYALGPTLARLGLRALETCTPQAITRPYMEALAQEVNATIFLGILCEDSILLVEKAEPSQGLRLAPPLGTTLPLQHTALGRVWLACCPATQRDALLAAVLPSASAIPAVHDAAELRRELAIIAQQGFAVTMETWLPDLCCLAAPLRNSRAELVAALAIVLPRSRMPQHQRHDPFTRHAPAWQYPTLLPALLRTTAQLAEVLV